MLWLHNDNMTTEATLSVAAIALSALSLGWQAISWRLEGARVVGWLSIEDASPVGNAIVVVHAINSGRSAATITDVRSPVTEKGAAGSSRAERRRPDSDPVPFRVEPGGHATWRYPITTGLTASEAVDFRYSDLRVVMKVNNRRNVVLQPM
jgi:hypothetical protein